MKVPRSNCHIFSLVFICVVLSLSNTSWSWSGSVHASIGRQVFELLDKKERAYYRALSTHIGIDQMQFHDLSAWVDSVRGQPVYELFETNVPEALFEFRQRHTSTWHYDNTFYHGNLKFHGVAKKHACRIQNIGKLERALLAVDKALQAKTTKKQEAILVAFAIHLLEDLHQPLHTTALVREDCSHDRGGNLYCLKTLGGHCAMNLHRLWDQAFSVTKDKKFMRSIELGSAPSLPFHTDLALVLSQGQQLAPEVYNTEENRMPHPEYFDWAADIARVQIEKSINKVTYYLKAHYERSSEK